MSPWMNLFIAGLFEIGFAASLKLSAGQTKIFWTAMFYACVIASFWFLNQAVKAIPIGTAYAVWTGVGAAGTAVVGIILFKEPATALRIAFLVLLIASIVGLRAVSGE